MDRFPMGTKKNTPTITDMVDGFKEASEFGKDGEVPAQDGPSGSEGVAAQPSKATARVLSGRRVPLAKVKPKNGDQALAPGKRHATREPACRLCDLATVACCTLSDQGLILVGNAAAAKLLGTTLDELIGHSIFRFIRLEHQERFRSQLEGLRVSGEAQPFESQMVKGCGTGFWAQLTAIAVRRPEGLLAYQIGMTDITPLKRTEQELNTVNGQLSSILASAGDSIAMMDTEYRYTIFNAVFKKEFEETFGVELKAGESMLQALQGHPEALSNGKVYWNRALGGESFIAEQAFGEEGAELRWYELHFSPIRNGDAEVVGAVHIVRNITERKQNEKEREALISRLQQANQEVAILRTFLPICAWCKEIRDDKGYWRNLECYLSEHADLTFTHSICPSCAEKLKERF